MAKAIKRTLDKHNDFGVIWRCQTPNFYISLTLSESFEAYDGDDENGEIQEAINSGELVTFDSKVSVEYDGVEIGTDYLGASVYKSGETLRFIKDGYFRDMLATACNEAREHVANLPRLRNPN